MTFSLPSTHVSTQLQAKHYSLLLQLYISKMARIYYHLYADEQCTQQSQEIRDDAKLHSEIETPRRPQLRSYNKNTAKWWARIQYFVGAKRHGSTICDNRIDKMRLATPLSVIMNYPQEKTFYMLHMLRKTLKTFSGRWMNYLRRWSEMTYPKNP